MLSSCETKIKNETEDNLRMSTAALSAFPSLHHTNSLLTQNHLWVNNAVRQAAFMSASGFPVNLHATLSSNPGLFSPAIFGTVWPASPQSPPSAPGSPISPTSKARKNNNNNIVSSSSGDIHQKTGRRKAPRKGQETVAISTLTEKSANISDASPSIGPLSPPTSGSSPPSSTGELSSAGKEPARDKQFTCGVCNRSFGYKHVLQNHERTHTGEKPFECPQCHKRFTRDHHLKTHMRLHTGERPYHCSHCDRHFVQVANLRRHLRVHTGERPYQCQQCSARFSDTNQLKAHALIHKGEKPYECERCHGRFRRKHHLMHHKCGMMPVVTPRITALAGLDSPDGIDTATTLTTSSTSSTSNISSLLPSPRSQKILSPVPNSDIGSEEEIEHPTDLSGSSEKVRERKSRDIRRVIRRPNVSPIITLPLHVALPEQTEPEDLSMSTGQQHLSNSHSSGDSSLSRSPSLDIRDDEEDDDEPDEAATLFLKQRTLVQQRNY